jgi:hypothetical protein
MSRKSCAAILGAACLAVGTVVRLNARKFATDPDGFNGRAFDGYCELGAWFVGFGLAVIVATIAVWISRD